MQQPFITVIVGCLMAGVIVIGVSVPAVADSGDAGAAQTIYLDPQTGQVTAAPGTAAQREHNAAVTQHSKQKSGGDKAWKTPEGVDMLKPGADKTPTTDVVHCPDGSLRMGQAGPQTPGQTAREALCAHSTR